MGTLDEELQYIQDLYDRGPAIKKAGIGEKVHLHMLHKYNKDGWFRFAMDNLVAPEDRIAILDRMGV